MGELDLELCEQHLNTLFMRTLLVCVVFLLLPLAIHAQFPGGTGSGHYSGSVFQTILTGNTIQEHVLFYGGSYAGFDVNSYNGSMDGVQIKMFSGRVGDGATSNDAYQQLNGTNLSSLFSGGEGNGHYQLAFASVVSGESVSNMFNASSGDGFDVQNSSFLLNGMPASDIYSGGFSDGTDYAGTGVVLNGHSIYNGGTHDGASVRFANSFLDESTYSLRFFGGAGDGFSAILVSAYISDPVNISSTITDFTESVTLYPNPISDNRLFIRFNTEELHTIEEIEVFNILGAKVSIDWQGTNPNVFVLKFNSELHAGAYTVQMIPKSDKEGIISLKFLVE
jgi:hypothetical protein